jgi:hypothetical protein
MKEMDRVRDKPVPAWMTLGLLLMVWLSISCLSVEAQSRGVYPLGMSATNSGVTPESGFTYSNQLLIYSRNQSKGPHGEVLATGSNSVVMDMNSLVWVSKKKILGGAKFSMSATVPIAKNSLTSDDVGAISGGGGLADSYYQPIIIGWQTERAGIRAIYGFLAPTGKFSAGASNNVGSGYWTHVVASGQTFFLTRNKATALSAFQMYEWHTTQKGTEIHPGQTLNLDYSLTHVIPVADAVCLQVGLVGYEQRQTTAKSGPTVTREQATTRYAVNALGFTSNMVFPGRNISVGVKYFREFLNRSTFQGYSLQISGSIKF